LRVYLYWAFLGVTLASHADWLDGAFSAGDLLMVSVLLRLKSSGMLDEYPNLSAYVARGEARQRRRGLESAAGRAQDARGISPAPARGTMARAH
jgi:glutathione S-transferase